MAMQNELASTDVYFAAVSPVLDLTVIQPEEAPHILPCFDEDDAGYGISKEEPLGFRYNPKQVIKLMGKRYLTGPVIFHRYTDDGKFAPLTMSDMFAIQKYLETASVTLMVDEDALTCICIDAVSFPSRWRDMGLIRSPANYPQTGLKFLSYTLPASTRV